VEGADGSAAGAVCAWAMLVLDSASIAARAMG
jgi:hypothetical protein